MYRKSLDKIKHAWRQFILEDQIEDFISPIIVESWRRCKGIEVDYRTGYGERIQDEKIKYIMKKNEELIKIARPIMQNLHSLVLGSGFVLITKVIYLKPLEKKT